MPYGVSLAKDRPKFFKIILVLMTVFKTQLRTLGIDVEEERVLGGVVNLIILKSSSPSGILKSWQTG